MQPCPPRSSFFSPLTQLSSVVVRTAIAKGRGGKVAIPTTMDSPWRLDPRTEATTASPATSSNTPKRASPFVDDLDLESSSKRTAGPETWSRDGEAGGLRTWLPDASERHSQSLEDGFTMALDIRPLDIRPDPTSGASSNIVMETSQAEPLTVAKSEDYCQPWNVPVDTEIEHVEDYDTCFGVVRFGPTNSYRSTSTHSVSYTDYRYR